MEYLSSLIGEIFLHAIWWDYSSEFMNINGRTCLYYAIIWGVLSVLLINYINPLIDKFYNFILEKTNYNNLKRLILIFTALFIMDSAVTCLAIENFLVNVSSSYNIQIKGIENKVQNDFLSKKYSNERMMMIYPNIIVLNDKNEIVYLSGILNNVKNYYYKF